MHDSSNKFVLHVIADMIIATYFINEVLLTIMYEDHHIMWKHERRGINGRDGGREKEINL